MRALPPVAVIAVCAVLCGCPKTDNPDGGRLDVTPDAATLMSGQTLQFAAMITPDAGPVSFLWSSESPTVADVDLDGLVTAKLPGKTTISATANGLTGTASVEVIGEIANCSTANSISTWTGTITLDYEDMITSSPSFTIKHTLNADFTLTHDVTKSDRWEGDPTGMGVIDEQEVSSGTTTHMAGSGSIYPIGPLTLNLDQNTCTFQFTFEWAVDAVLTVNGTGSVPQNKLNVGAITSKKIPLPTDFESGLSYSAGFNVYGTGAPSSEDVYVPVTLITELMLMSNPGPRGPAQVTFTAKPD